MTGRWSASPDQPPADRRRFSLKFQFVLLLCLAMGPAAVIGFLESLAAFHRQAQKAEESLLQNAMISVLSDRQVIAGARVMLESLAGQDDIKAHTPGICATTMRKAIQRSHDYENLMITDTSGHPVCASRDIKLQGELSDRPWFRELATGADFAVSTLIISRLTGLPTVVAAVPLRGDDGAFAGMLSAAIYLGALTGRTNDSVAAVQPVTLLLDDSGRAVPQERGADLARQLPPPDVVRAQLSPRGGTFRARAIDGETRLYALAPVIDGKLTVIAAQAQTGLLGDASPLMWGVLAVPLMIWLVAIITMWIGLERLVLRWVSYLGRVGAGYGRGHYLAMPRAVVRAPTEFQELGRTLSQMALTARSRQRDLQAALDQKNSLVREIHHRVKNNLQIIQSLLNLQSRSAGDSNQFTALAAAKSRINALALVHQSLYEDENLEYVNLRSFLNDLCRHLLQSGWGAAKRVRINVDVPDVVTNADHAVPISLLVTEAVTNALKHAFFGRDVGTITVRMVNDPATGAELTIRDDGIGMDASPRPQDRPHAGIGYSLIEGFARQLRGSVQTISDNGTTLRVNFPHLKGRMARAS